MSRPRLQAIIFLPKLFFSVETLFIFNNLFDTYEINISSTLGQQELKVHPI